jgi:hypothetical protein
MEPPALVPSRVTSAWADQGSIILPPAQFCNILGEWATSS